MRAPQQCILTPVGYVQSSLKELDQAPRQGEEGAPEAWVAIDDAYRDALDGLTVGDELVLITWLHQSDRRVLKVHPRSDPHNPLTGVFATRSPDRPNPLGLHRVTLLQLDGPRLRVAPLEAIDGTPVLDVKPWWSHRADP
jgi:tRNA-Thr(GGU) m(6)t(6)A37 methyltransferase TsaA